MTVITGRKTKRGGRAAALKVVGSSAENISPFQDRSILYTSLQKFNSFWTYMDTIKIHGYTRAAISLIGRSTVGAWWTLVKHSEYGRSARDLQRRRLYSFYNMSGSKTWKNIKDYYTLAYKILIGVMYLRYFGQCAYQIIRNQAGVAIGFDFLPGLVAPNVTDAGDFKTPAFYQYPSKDPSQRIGFAAEDIIYIVNPDWEGSPFGSSDIESLGEFALPLDLYLQTAARAYLQNTDRPEVIYQVPSDISEDAFDDIVKYLEAHHRGAANVGKNLLVIQGEINAKELKGLPKDLPYQQARDTTRDEVLAATSVSGAKLGISKDLTAGNLREIRREFHETAMIPLFRFVEQAFYEQIHLREFGIQGWEFKFNNPDFLTLVERATVDMRYYTVNSVCPDEIRAARGLAPRPDGRGKLFADQVKQAELDVDQPGSPPEGRPVEPDDPSQTGEPTLDDQDPPRGDQHDDEPRNSALTAELRRWKTFALRRTRKGQRLREFHSDVIPDSLRELIQAYLQAAGSPEEINELFGVVFNEVVS